jgi:hypothetical protein
MDSQQAVPAPEPASDPRVDEVVAGLRALDGLDLAEHPAILQEVHGRLREILGELGDAAGPAEPGRPGEQGELSRQREQGEPSRQREQGAFGGAARPRPGGPVPGAWERRPHA